MPSRTPPRPRIETVVGEHRHLIEMAIVLLHFAQHPALEHPTAPAPSPAVSRAREYHPPSRGAARLARRGSNRADRARRQTAPSRFGPYCLRGFPLGRHDDELGRTTAQGPVLLGRAQIWHQAGQHQPQNAAVGERVRSLGPETTRQKLHLRRMVYPAVAAGNGSLHLTGNR